MSSAVKDKDIIENVGDFGSINKELRKIQLANLKRQVAKGNDPISIGRYKLSDENRIEMSWHFHGTTEIIFRGEILLDGDALKGTFYKNGKINVPSRVYYNIDKPIPDPLISEDNGNC